MIPANEGDFLTATKFVNIMIRSGLTVHRATAPLTAGGKTYPAGSYVFKAAQAYRPHLLDMFEPQDHPNDLQFPGGPPIPPYDNAGWTLAYQMGLKFDRVLENVDGPLEKIADVITPAAGQVTSAQGAVGFTVPHRLNDSFKAVNRLLKAGEEVFFVGDRSFQSQDGTGVIYITAKPSTAAVLQKAAADFGLTFTGVTSRPAGALYKLTKPRIALWDQYGGSMPSGHTRWLLEQFEFDFEVIYPQTLDAGNLKAKYDVILFPDGGIPETDNAGGGFGGRPAHAAGGAGGVPRAPGPRHHRQDGAAAEALRRRGRRDRGLRRLRRARLSPRPAGERSPGGGAAERRGSAAAAHQVLHPRLDHARRRGQHHPARVRLREAGRRVLREQPGDAAGAERGARAA